MNNNDYKEKVSKIILKAQKNGLVKKYSDFCNTKEGKQNKLTKKEIIYYNLKRRKKLMLINRKTIKRNLFDEEIERKLLMSEEDYKNGRIKKAEDVFKDWEKKYGI